MSRRRAGVLLGYANIVVKNVVNLLYTPMLLAFVGRGDYGVFQTAHSFVFSLTLLSFGFSGAYVRFYTQRKAGGDDAGISVLNGMYLLLYLAICAVVVAVGLFFSANVGSVFAESFTADEVSLASALMSIMTFNVATTLLSTVFDANIIVHEEFSFQQTRQMVTTVATPGLALVLLWVGCGAVGVALAQLAVSTVLLILNASFAIRHLGMRFDFSHFDRGLFRAIATFSAWIFANQVCEMINQNVPNVLLGAACGAATVAVFAVALQMRSLFYSLSTTMSGVFVPLVNRLVADSNNDEELTRLMTRVGRYQALLYLWVFGGFIVVGKWFVEKWAGIAFSDAYYLILAMGAPLFIPLVQNVGIEIQKAKNMHRARSLAYLVFAVINLLLTSLLAPHLGYWAPAVGFDAYVIMGTGLFMNWYYHNRVGLDMGYYWKMIAPLVGLWVAAVVPCVVGTMIVPVAGFPQFICWGVVYTVVYVALLGGFALNANERDSLRRRLKAIGGHLRG